MNPNTTMQTLVVHVDQLTPDNMKQLAESGYSIIRDPSLLIFVRPLPQENLVTLDTVPSLDGNEENNQVPVQLPNRRNV